MNEDELEKVYDGILEDEYIEFTHPMLRTTLNEVICYLKHYNGCSFNRLSSDSRESQALFYRTAADIIKLSFLGYISISNDEEQTITLGSNKIYKKIDSFIWPLRRSINHTQHSNFFKCWLNSKISDGNLGLIILEDLYKENPELVFNQLFQGKFIISISSVRILERKYLRKFPEKLVNHLIIANEIYHLRNDGHKIVRLKDYDLLKGKPYKTNRFKIANFINHLNKNKIKYKLYEDKVHILDDFYLDTDIDLPDNLVIYGNLIIKDFLKYKYTIPRNLKVNRYIRFGKFQYDTYQNANVDVFLGLNQEYYENNPSFEYL